MEMKHDMMEYKKKWIKTDVGEGVKFSKSIANIEIIIG